jgi:hypothetical protein
MCPILDCLPRLGPLPRLRCRRRRRIRTHRCCRSAPRSRQLAAHNTSASPPAHPATRPCASPSQNMSIHFHTKARFITPESNPLQVAVTLIDGKRERMTLNQSFTGTSPASLCILCATVVCPRRCCAPTAPRVPACSPKPFHSMRNANQFRPQLAPSTPTFPSSLLACLSRSLAAFHPGRSPTMPPRWHPPAFSMLWCGRPRADAHLTALADAPLSALSMHAVEQLLCHCKNFLNASHFES